MIAVFGTICLDRIYEVPRIPRSGGYVEITSTHELLGGEAANTAYVLKSLGMSPSLYCNPVGNDPAGKFLCEKISIHHLTLPLIVEDHHTPICDIYVTPDGERTMFGHDFSKMSPKSAPTIEGTRIEWLTAEPNMRATAYEVLDQAQKQGIKTYLMDFTDESDALHVANCELFQTSTDWAGEPGNTKANLIWTSEWASRFDCKTVLTDGKNGLFAAEPNGKTQYFPSFPPHKIVDSTGAGDAFRATLLYNLSLGTPFIESLKYAASAGSLACGTFGGTTAEITLESIAEVIEHHPEIAEHYV